MIEEIKEIRTLKDFHLCYPIGIATYLQGKEGYSTTHNKRA